MASPTGIFADGHRRRNERFGEEVRLRRTDQNVDLGAHPSPNVPYRSKNRQIFER